MGGIAERLSAAGCTHVRVGHSERRTFCGIDDAAVAARVRAALDGGLVPIVCVGERLEERDGGVTMEVIGRQVAAAAAVLQPGEAARVVWAYEPVWAIGTGRTASPGGAQEVHAFVRGLIVERFGSEVGAQARSLYGGSGKPDNAAALMDQADVDGALVGGASLDAEAFMRSVRSSGPGAND